MTSQPSKQGILIHILPNIGRHKGIQAMEFGNRMFIEHKKHFS